MYKIKRLITLSDGNNVDTRVSWWASCQNIRWLLSNMAQSRNLFYMLGRSFQRKGRNGILLYHRCFYRTEEVILNKHEGINTVQLLEALITIHLSAIGLILLCIINTGVCSAYVQTQPCTRGPGLACDCIQLQWVANSTVIARYFLHSCARLDWVSVSYNIGIQLDRIASAWLAGRLRNRLS